MVMKLKQIPLLAACATILLALPTGASANIITDNNKWNYLNNKSNSIYYNHAGQDVLSTTNFDDYKLESNGASINGNILIINFSNTTGSAVNISFNSTTSAAVNISYDTTTSPAVRVSYDNSYNFNDILNNYRKEEEKFNEYMKYMDEMFERQFDEMEKQQEKFWDYMMKRR